MDSAISIRGVTKTFGPKVAVEDLDLVVPRGTLCGFIGPNGAGKTTTIRMIMSIIFPDKGEINVLGKRSALESKDRIGYLPEERGLYRKMKVGALLNYLARLKGMDVGATDAKVKKWLDRVELGSVYKKKCEELSKGMQQKVQFIAAVIHEPELIILDEVFSGLDPVNRRLMRELIDEQHRGGRTIVFSTHAMFEAEQLCDQIFMIHNGRKRIDGKLSEVLAKFDPRCLIVEPMEADAGGALERLEGVAGVRVPENGLRGALEVMLKEGVTPGSAMSRIVAAMPVRKIEIKRATLEDVFIDIVSRQEGVQISRDVLAGAGASLEGGE